MTKKTQTSGRNFRGNARPRLTLLAAGVSLALSPFGNAWADSATGTDTSVSNAMNQGIAAGPAKVDAELDLKRSPAGILYGYDNILPQPRRKTGDGIGRTPNVSARPASPGTTAMAIMALSP